MASSPVNFRPRNLAILSTLDRIGDAMDRDRSYMINEAIEAYVELNEWQVEQIKAGLQEADENQFADQSEVDKILGRKRK